MGWGRTFLLGDIGNRLDIEDCEKDMRMLKETLMQENKDNLSRDQELTILRRENDQMKLYIAAIVRLLTNKKIFSIEEITKMIDIIDAEDGAIDGKTTGEII